MEEYTKTPDKISNILFSQFGQKGGILPKSGRLSYVTTHVFTVYEMNHSALNVIILV